jgi:hypothetical protein
MSVDVVTDAEMLERGYTRGPKGSWRPPGGATPRSETGSVSVPVLDGRPRPARESVLPTFTVSQIRERVAAAGRREFVVKGLIPERTYGVIGARAKGAKSITTIDLMVSVATGSPWLDHFPIPQPGPVLGYLGEGDEAANLRRIDAILAARGGDASDLSGLRLCPRVPRLTEREHLIALESEMQENPPKLVVVDPVYIAQAGTKTASLVDVGERLAGIQELCQAAGAVLLLVWHWNQTGNGSGAQRFTGAGAWEWGRFLGSAEVERKVSEPAGASLIQTRWEFTGSEIPDRAFRVRQRIWADDAADLNSPLHYEVDVSELEDIAAGTGLSPSRQRVLTALLQLGELVLVRQIGDVVADDGKGKPLRARTIQDALRELEGSGLAEGTEAPQGGTRYWSPRVKP